MSHRKALSLYFHIFSFSSRAVFALTQSLSPSICITNVICKGRKKMADTLVSESMKSVVCKDWVTNKRWLPLYSGFPGLNMIIFFLGYWGLPMAISYQQLLLNGILALLILCFIVLCTYVRLCFDHYRHQLGVFILK